MTPDETLLLKHAGQVLVVDFASVVVVTFCYGAEHLWKHSSLLLTKMHQVSIKNNKTTATWALCALLTVIFSITTTSVCLDVAISFKLMIGALIKNPELELSERLEIANASIKRMLLAESWLNGRSNSLLLILGDGIVVWRAWAIWDGQHRVIILPGLTLLAAFALFLAENILQTIPSNPTNFLDGKLASLITGGATMSIVTNLIAIILIGLKTYQHWKFMKDTIGPGRSAAGKVLMFLTESGIVYIAFQIINISLSTLDTTQGTALDIATRIWTIIMNSVSAIYPSLVILIVTNQHSISHITHGSTGVGGGDGNPGTHISFAHSAPQQTTDSTEDQAEAAVQSMIERHHDIEKTGQLARIQWLVQSVKLFVSLHSILHHRHLVIHRHILVASLSKSTLASSTRRFLITLGRTTQQDKHPGNGGVSWEVVEGIARREALTSTSEATLGNSEKSLKECDAIGNSEKGDTGDTAGSDATEDTERLLAKAFVSRLCQIPAIPLLAPGLARIHRVEKAIADLPFMNGNIASSGVLTNLFWRSAYLSTLFSLRNRTLVMDDWLITKIFWRDSALGIDVVKEASSQTKRTWHDALAAICKYYKDKGVSRQQADDHLPAAAGYVHLTITVLLVKFLTVAIYKKAT
ncbi:hypothetical protein C8J56DRAFT_1032560 [Mycena floridula]|nr:hypothetical protein C8J56DRAFT_1032560 [Mycena floridula]